MTFDREPAADDPQWPRASAWLDGSDATVPDDDAPRLRVVGVPTSAGSISHSEAWRTPPAVRRALARLSTWDPVGGVDLRTAVAVEDLGDWDVADLALVPAMDRVHDLAAGLDDTAAVHVFLGGDNAITRPVTTGLLGPDLDDIGVITLDAHHDVRHLDDGPTNGSPVRGLLADGLPGANVVQVGLGRFTNAPVHARWAAAHGIRGITVDQVHERGIRWAVGEALAHLSHVRAIHVDLDVDVLDVAHAPACPGARPGGLLPHHLHEAAGLLAAAPRVRSFDLVEVDAATDHDGRTVMVCATTLLRIASGLTDR